MSSPCRLRRILGGICSILVVPSAAGWNGGAGTCLDLNARRNDPPQDIDSLPPLEELFGDLQGDDYIDGLEELAESLLREVTAEVEANPSRSNEQMPIAEDTPKKRDYPKRMVGQTSKDVEASRTSESLNGSSTWQIVGSTNTGTILPVNSAAAFKNATGNAAFAVKAEPEIKTEIEPPNDCDTVYGTYDEATNSITIIYPGQESEISIQECVQEVVTDEHCQSEDTSYLTPENHRGARTLHSPAYTVTDSMSPYSAYSEETDTEFTVSKVDSNPSDAGYESHGSVESEPCSQRNSLTLADLWPESFSELFPTLA